MASKIEWTGSTWNPIVGCSVVSPGCTNCYAMGLAARLERMGQERYAGLTQPTKAGPVWTGEVRLVEDALTLPLRTRKPTTWFVNSMSDLFHESVPNEWIDRVFAVMALCPQHTFQILTKRSARLRAYANETDAAGPVRPWRLNQSARWLCLDQIRAGTFCDSDKTWPLPNVWLGVSAEDQRRAEERVPDLLATPAAIRFVSAEPLLGLTRLWTPTIERAALRLLGGELPGIDWVIVGGESGRAARPMHPEWARVIRDDCASAGVAYFFKQWGAFSSGVSGWALAIDGSSPGPDRWNHPDTAWMNRVGKRAAGRLLDGAEHNEMPR